MRFRFRYTAVLALIFLASSVVGFAQPLCWKVCSKKATVYLLGSIHFADKTFYPLPESLEKAFDESSTLVVELDPEAITPDLLMSNLTFKDKSALADHVSKAGYVRINKAFSEAKIPDFLWKSSKPFAAGLIYTSLKYLGMGISPEYGIDVHFLKQAREQGKEIVELENITDQTNLFDNLSDSLNEVFLLKAIDEVDTTNSQMESLAEAWKTGDEKALEELVLAKAGNSDADSIYNQILLYNRNNNMLDRINSLLKSNGKYFVVVGAAHLIGDKGIIQLLKRNKKNKIKLLR